MAKTTTDDTKLLGELRIQYTESDKDLARIRDNGFTWDEREELLVGVLADAGSEQAKSKVNTQDLANLVLDGASRVMAQFPTGTIQAVTEDDKGKSVLMNIVHEKYILPNANSQYDLMTKFRMWDIYSRVFGSMPALVDYRVDDQYIGPDIWLIHPRSFFPQAGATNVQQMQYCQVSTWVSMDYLQSRDPKVWKNVKDLIRLAKLGAKTKSQQESNKIPTGERNEQLQPEDGKFGQIELRTRYERDRWVTYAPDYNLVVRDIPNPQGNNELPIVMKHCFPLLDRLYGMAEFERGYSLQYAANSLVNMYMDGVRMSIFPPIMVDTTGVVASSLDYVPGAKWLMTKPGSISQLQLTPQGMQTFNSTYGFLKSAMLNMGATTDTSVNADTDPGMGKTPQALKMQGNREGARDNWDRFMMEQALEEVTNKFIALLVTKQEKPIELTVFKAEIEKIKEAYPNEEVVKVFNSQEAGSLSIPKKMWGNAKFKYTVDPGSTMKADDDKEHQSLTEIIGLMMKFPTFLQQAEQTGKFNFGDKTFDFGFAVKRYITSSGMQDAEKVITDNKELQGEQGQQNMSEIASLKQQMEQVAQIVQQLAQKTQEAAQNPTGKAPSEMISYKDATPFIKSQMEAQAGMTPDPSHENEHIVQLTQHAKTIDTNLNPPPVNSKQPMQ